MGFLRRLLGGSSAQSRECDAWRLAPSRDEAVLQVVGEGTYQDALGALGGRKTSDGPTSTDFLAGLIREANNRYDENAIQVQIDGRRVGYLSREDAIRYRPVVDWAMAREHLIVAHARLTGGWDRGGGDSGSFGVILHVGTPSETLLELLGDEVVVKTDHPWPDALIAFTGDSRYTLSGVALDRECSTMLAHRAGLHVNPRITKKVRLLVDCDPGTESGNELKAIQYGIQIISEADFWATLGIDVQPAAAQWGQRPSWQGSSH
jgi:hypothetical protein